MSDLGRPFLEYVKTQINTALPSTPVWISGVEGRDEDLTYPYLVIWPVPPTRGVANLTGTLRPADVWMQMVGVALDPSGVITVLERAAGAIVGRRPVIEGWGPGFIREVPVNQPVTDNPQIVVNGRSTFRSWSQFRMGAEPAPVTGS